MKKRNGGRKKKSFGRKKRKKNGRNGSNLVMMEVVNMEFCPKCGNLMVPVRKHEKTVLKCRACGYELEKTRVDYKISHHVGESKHVITSKVSEEKGRSLRRSEEREILQEYYEVFLETFSEEESGSEESS